VRSTAALHWRWVPQDRRLAVRPGFARWRHAVRQIAWVPACAASQVGGAPARARL